MTDLSARVMAMFTTRAIERSQALYLQTGNPIHAWHVYEHARNGRVPIPDWVLDYLDKVAKALTALPGPASVKAVAATALGLDTKGGPSKARQAETDQRHLEIVTHIVLLQKRAKAADADLDLQDNLGIMQRVADDCGLSLDRVQAVYSKMTRPRRRSPA